MAADPVSNIAAALKEVAQLIREWVAGQPVRKLRSGVDLADRIFKRYHEVTPLNNRDKIIDEWIDDFYDRIT